MKLKDLVKIAAPIAIGSIAPGLMPGMNPVLARGLASGVGSLVTGTGPYLRRIANGGKVVWNVIYDSAKMIRNGSIITSTGWYNTVAPYVISFFTSSGGRRKIKTKKGRLLSTYSKRSSIKRNNKKQKN